MSEETIRNKVRKGIKITMDELQFICNEYYMNGYNDCKEENKDYENEE